MALRVWLPLNGNLENKGLSGVQVTNTGAIINNNGKIGQAYEFGTGNSYLTVPYQIANNFTECSVCFWVKILSWNTDYATFIHIGKAHYDWNSYIFGILRNGSSSKLCFTISTGSYSTSNSYTTPDLSLNTWYHLAFTYTLGKCSIYINGSLYREYAASTIPDFSQVADITIGKSNNKNQYQTNCLMNDVRIYDECLSPKQVKEISKGLVVHYKLDTPKALDNIARNSTYVVYNNYSSSGTTGSLVKLTERYNNCDIYRLTMTPNETSVSNFQTSLASHGIYGFRSTFKANTKYCFWILWRPVTHKDVVVGGTASNIGGWYEISSKDWGGGWRVVGQYRNGSVTSDKTDNVFTSFKTPTAQAGVPISIDFCCPHLVEGIDYILPEFDYAGTITTQELDCSGNGYHGTISGTLNYNLDSTRYSGSTKFETNTSYIKMPILTTGGFANSFTIIYWAKITDMNGKMAWGFGDGNRLNIYPSSSVFCCNTGDGSNNQYKNNGTAVAFTPYNNAWHQYAMVGDGTANKLYIDGIYAGTATTYKGITGSQLYVSGWDTGTSYRWTNGSISDFRIYSTALSADDILTMYKNSGIIDNKGNVYAYELQENEDNIFKSENIMKYTTNRTSNGYGQIVKRAGENAIAINPSTFWQTTETQKGIILKDEVKSNTQYFLDMWIDADDVVYQDRNVNQGLRVTYTDGTGINLTVTGDKDNKKGFQHLTYLTDASKSVYCFEQTYWVGIPNYYRWDTAIIPVNKDNLNKQGIWKSTEIIENSDKAKIHQSGVKYLNSFIEL